MKKKHSLRGILVCLILLIPIFNYPQSTGDIAFIGFNTDGNKDFSIVVLTNIAPETTIYFTDDETDESGGLIGSEGIITWKTGHTTIQAGTTITFTDVDNESNPHFNASIGSITRHGSFSLSGSKDGIIAYTGLSPQSPTTYLAAIQIGNSSAQLGPFDDDNVTLTNTGLVIGATIVVIDMVASPDGGKYNGSRFDKTIYSDYTISITNKNNWTIVSSTGNGESLLPFKDESFTTNSTTWTGTSSAVWNLSGNWNNGIPTSSSLVSIPDVVTSPIISSGTEAQAGNITIETGETLTINTDNALTISGELTVSGALNANSGSSIIIKGTSIGDISYTRTLTTNWHLIASPVDAQNINIFTVTDVATNAIATSGANYGVAPYDNNGTAWDYYTTENIGTAGNFISGKGYSALRTTAGDITFTGTIPTTNISTAIIDGTSNKWNLIGNPYPSYIPANSNANATNSFIDINATALHASYQAVYFWNGATYAPINNASSARYIAPGQGFFVNAISGGSTVNFTEAMQSHQSTNEFSKASVAWPQITIHLTDGSSSKSTEVKYITGCTTGLDPGYDAGMFTGLSNQFSVYTQLVGNNSQIKFALQALPDNDYENIIIPIGINATSGKEISFSINHQNLPTDLMVFIEDLQENKITRIDYISSSYTISLAENQTGIGRFYLRTSVKDLTKTLTSTENNIEKFNCNYVASLNLLRIKAPQNSLITLVVYTLSGKRVLKKQLQTSSTSTEFPFPNSIKSGLYLIKLKINNRQYQKKIILNKAL